MCRWLSYVGSPIYPYQYLYDDPNSLIHQSQKALKSKSVVNGDGFGLGWYTENLKSPGLFKDKLPAWNDENLKSFSSHIESRLFFAHVRAATNAEISRANCHPFKLENRLFMHNGQIGDYQKLRREVEMLIGDDLYPHRKGTTDSEALFLILESLLVEKGFHEACESLIGSIERFSKSQEVTKAFRFTAAYTDGEKLFGVRYSSDKYAPTLFVNKILTGWLLASEPLNENSEEWDVVPANHTVEIDLSLPEPLVRPVVIGGGV